MLFYHHKTTTSFFDGFQDDSGEFDHPIFNSTQLKVTSLNSSDLTEVVGCSEIYPVCQSQSKVIKLLDCYKLIQ